MERRRTLIGIVEYDSWRPSLTLLLERRVRFCFTCYNECEVIAAGVVLREQLGWRRSLQQHLNPFRQPLERASVLTGGALDAPWSSDRLLVFVDAAGAGHDVPHDACPVGQHEY